MNDQIQFQSVQPENAPWDLLLLADPSEKNVKAYLEKGICYIAKIANEIVGEFVLLPKSQQVYELMNIAVLPEYQGQKIGKILLRSAISISQQRGATELELGTGNSSLSQLAFYQKAGFRIVGVIPNFFIDNYEEPIYENGIQCRDMIRLKLNLS